MSVNKVKHRAEYQLSIERGFSGNLMCDPSFEFTNDDREYANIPVYWTRNVEDGDTSYFNDPKEVQRKLNLKAYIKIYDEELLEDIEYLEKGDLVYFQLSSLRTVFYIDEETGDVRHYVDATAIDLQLKRKARAKRNDTDQSYVKQDRQVKSKPKKQTNRRQSSRANRRKK